MEESKVSELREAWRQKRFKKLIERILRGRKDQSISISSKLLGINVNVKQDNAQIVLPSSKPAIGKSQIISGQSKKLPRSLSEPKILPRETKLSAQRKCLLDPRYKLTKYIGNSKSLLEINKVHSNQRAVQVNCKKTVQARCSNSAAVLQQRNQAAETIQINVELAAVEERRSLESDIDKNSVLEAALSDLASLIKKGHPIKDCEKKLAAMGDTYPMLKNSAFYWECKALLTSKSATSNMQSEQSLLDTEVSDLVNKFEILNLHTPNKAALEENTKKCRALSEISVNNLLNSSSIQFSVKKKKKPVDNFVVTPVRRSTRTNRCQPDDSKSDVKYVTSVLDLSQEIRENMDFEPNFALFD